MACGTVLIVPSGDLCARDKMATTRGSGLIDLAAVRTFAALAPTL